MYRGIGASAGYGIGKVVIIGNELPDYEDRKIENIEEEKSRFEDAVETFIQITTKMVEEMKEKAGEHNAEILQGHIMMLADPFMQDEIKNKIGQGICAEKAVDETCSAFIDMFSSTGDELTMQRATDIKDIRVRLLRILTNTKEQNIEQILPGSIIVAKDLTPSMTTGLVKENIEGIVTEVGGKTSHSAILARALEIPCVLSIENITSYVENGTIVALDGCEGKVYINPEENLLGEYKQKKSEYMEKKNSLNAYKGKETVTKDDIKVELYGNIGKTDDVSKVVENDGEGIGLFRTEFLFMDCTKEPSEEEQFRAYKQVAEAMSGKEVIIRTLDIGGDKDIPYLGLEKEENPFLGFRAVRFCLYNTALYKKQLRAILRASAYGDIKIMVPLVTCIDEIRAVKDLVSIVKEELEAEGIAYNKDIEIGTMIETPAASEIADLLAKEADFFSIGTNDLIGYTMAVDRGNSKVSYLYSPYNPAVIRSIRRIIKAAKDEGIKVGMCGEAAADPMLLPLLLAYGLDEFSVSANAILETRARIAKWTKDEACKIADKVMTLATEKEIVEYLKSL